MSTSRKSARKGGTNTSVNGRIRPQVREDLMMLAFVEAVRGTRSHAAKAVGRSRSNCKYWISKERGLYEELLAVAKKAVDTVGVGYISESGRRVGTPDRPYYTAERAEDLFRRVLGILIEKLVSLTKAVKLAGPHMPTFRDLRKKYAAIYEEVCKDLGLYWAGEHEAAPKHLWIRARLKRAALYEVSGFSREYTAKQLGPWVRQKAGKVIKHFPEYWKFLCEQERENSLLAQGDVALVTVVRSKDGKSIAHPRRDVRKAIKQVREKTPHHATKNLKRAFGKGTWWHPAEAPLPKEYPFGPLEGTKTLLGKCLAGTGKEPARKLVKSAKAELVWVQRISRQCFQVWFRQEGLYLRIQDRMAKLKPAD